MWLKIHFDAPETCDRCSCKQTLGFMEMNLVAKFLCFMCFPGWMRSRGMLRDLRAREKIRLL